MFSKRSFFLIALLFGFTLVARADNGGPSGPQTPIEGTVVSISQVDDLFLLLDTNGDGTGDIWIKIEHDGQLLDEAGQSISPSSIVLGMLLTLTRYDFEGSYYEVSQAVVSQGEPKGNVGLSGQIVLAFPFGNTTVLSLDFNRDGQADTVVKVNRHGLITDMQGQLLGPNTLQVGKILSIVSHTLDSEGGILAWHVIVGDAEMTAPALPTVLGVVAQQYDLAGFRYLLLDDNSGLAVAQNYLDSGGLIPIQLDGQTLLQDPEGQLLSFDKIQIGTSLDVRDYEFVEGYFKAKRVVIVR